MQKLRIDDLQFSYYSLMVLIFIHSGALLSVFFSQIPWFYKLIASVIILLSFIYYYRSKLLKPNIFQYCERGEDDIWILTRTNGQQLKAFLSKSSLLTTFLIILNFKIIDDESRTLFSRRRRYTLILFADSLPSECFRELRCDLLLGG